MKVAVLAVLEWLLNVVVQDLLLEHTAKVLDRWARYKLLTKLPKKIRRNTYDGYREDYAVKSITGKHLMSLGIIYRMRDTWVPQEPPFQKK